MKILYWFLGHPEEAGSFLPFLKEGDAFLLSGSALLIALREGQVPFKAGVRILVLDIDLRARGFDHSDLREGVEVISFPDLVKLMRNYSKIITWP